MRRLALVDLLLMRASPVAAQEPRGPLVFAAQVESVFIDAFVARDGASISGLKEGDFILIDNGKGQAFDLIPVDSVPIRAVLVFDTSSSMSGARLSQLRAAASSFLDELRPQDEAALVSFHDQVAWLSPLTPDLGQVRRALSSLRAQGATSLYDALFAALVMPQSASRTLVILFSDGQDTMSWLRETDLRRLVQRANALIHVVSARIEARGWGAPPNTESADLNGLRELAEITGGSLIEVQSPERIEAAFTRIIEDMKNRYILRYTPETEPTPGWHKLEIRLRSRKGKVRGRAGYWVDGR